MLSPIGKHKLPRALAGDRFRAWSERQAHKLVRPRAETGNAARCKRYRDRKRSVPRCEGNMAEGMSRHVPPCTPFRGHFQFLIHYVRV
jgi:hypothetical protein